MSANEVYEELNEVLQDNIAATLSIDIIDKVSKLMCDYFDTDTLKGFIEHIKEENQ